MANQVVGNKFTWIIKNFTSLRSKIIYSDEFEIGGCKWRLLSHPVRHKKRKYMPLYLEVADSEILPTGWRRHTRFSLTVVNQASKSSSIKTKRSKWFDQKTTSAGCATMIPLSKLSEQCGFEVNGEVKIVVKVDVLKVIGKVDVVLVESGDESEEISEVKCEEDSEEESGDESAEKSEEESGDVSAEESEEESEEHNRPRKKTKRNDDGAGSSASHNETRDVKGFQVLPSQVNLVKRIFLKYPDIAVEFRAKNPHLKTACMNVVLSLIQTLCQSTQKLTDEDLLESDNALAYVKDAGFKVDWLDKKLDEVKEKKEEEQTRATRTKELEKELKEIKRKCSDMEALLKLEKAKLVTIRAHPTLDGFL